MKRKLLLSVAILCVTGFSCFSLVFASSVPDMSSLDNIEMLTQTEGGNQEWGCGGNPTYIPNETLRSDVCITGGTHLKCKVQSGVCCNPSDQTDCPAVDVDLFK